MRIHIGRITPALAERIDELESRLDRFGKRTSKLSLHKKEFGMFYFAFVDMDLDSKQYGALRTALNGVTFRQSKLEIKQAQPSYYERMQFGQTAENEKEPKERLNPEQLKRTRSAPPREIGVFPGRMRTSSKPRPDATFRVSIKGEIRKPKMRKRKLWGIMRKPLNKLTDHFVDGEWRDSEGKAIEIVAALHDEHTKALQIAEELAKASAYLSDSDFEEFKETARDIGQADSDDEIEVVPRGTVTQPSGRVVELSSEDEHENMDTHMDTDAPKSTAENLRSALSADTPFTLFGPPPEENDEAQAEPLAAKPAAAPAAPTSLAPIESEPKVGLFFTHNESPYLRSLSQAAKLVGEFDAAAWEKEFYENRSEWNRSLRKRRRDADRMARRMGKKRGEQ